MDIPCSCAVTRMIRNALLPLCLLVLATLIASCTALAPADNASLSTQTPTASESASLAVPLNAPESLSPSSSESLPSDDAAEALSTNNKATQRPALPSVLQQTAPAAPLPRIPTDTLYALLAAEIAGSRSNYEVALTHYAEQARTQRDPQLAERATLIARYVDNKPLAYEMATLWHQLAPQHIPALANAALASLYQGHLLEAFGYSEKLLALNEPTLFQMIAANAEKNTAVDRPALLDAFNSVLKTHPHDEQLLVGAALLYEQERRYEEALTASQHALNAHPTSFAAAVLEANLLHQLMRTPEAVEKMRLLVERAPDNIPLRQQFAFMLIKTNIADAKEQLQWLSDKGSKDGYVLLLLGQIAVSENNEERAIDYYEQLVDSNQHRQTAHFELGKLYQARGNTTDAIIHFLQVNDNDLYLSAANRLLALFLFEQDIESADEHMERLYKRLPEHKAALYAIYGQALVEGQQLAHAITLFDTALSEFPNDIELRYSRGMLFYHIDRLTDAERDFKAALALEPTHVATLNSLGYMLAEKTERFEEAHQLLTRALALSPDDAAIIDSMGWLLYRQGTVQEALTYLQRAYTLAPLADIAAHLGEVLWIVGREQDALTIWREGLSRHPEASVILNTIKRLDADS